MLYNEKLWQLPQLRLSAHAAILRNHVVSQFGAVVLAAADGGQDGAAAVGRNARGVDDVHGVLSGGAAVGLRLRARGAGAARIAATRRGPRRVPAAAFSDFADCSTR